ncbi:unnamed protein product [Linum trigynum]|uniref:Uncharacterized protein n=1 Tax=Linum trigynum TaxID=586398 RepID=A0AAV2GPG8_9ROSI
MKRGQDNARKLFIGLVSRLFKGNKGKFVCLLVILIIMDDSTGGNHDKLFRFKQVFEFCAFPSVSFP